ALLGACKNSNQMKLDYPKTKTVDVSEDFFGTEVPDPYKWMENESDTDLVAWIKAENIITQKYLSQISFKQDIYDHLKEIYNYERRSVPYKRGEKYFYYKNDGLQNQAVLYVMDSLGAEPQILLDPNQLSDDGTVALATTAISKDGKYLAYAIARSGSDWNEIYVKNIETGQLLTDHIEWVKFSGISWYKDGFFYSRYDEPVDGTELSSTNENQRVYYHKIGNPQNGDIIIYEDISVPSHGFSASVSDDEKYLFINEWKGTSGSIIYFKDIEKNGEFVKLNDNFDYDYNIIKHIDGKLLIKTNYNAPNYKVFAVDPNNPELENWVDFLPETDDVLESISFGKEKIIVEYMHDVKSVLKIYDFNAKFIADVELPGIGNVSSVSANKDDNFFLYKFSSFTTPGNIIKFSFEDNSIETYYSTKFDGIDLDKFVVEQIFYESKDGTKIPMFLIHKKDIKLDGKNPTWLYAYGGFNISITPYFDVRKLPWLENGGVYAIANIRGGGEYGEKWHKQGILDKKQNVFDDFIAAGEYLIEKKYTNSDLLAIQGGSNGGLLVGAVVNQRPDLVKVALPAVGVMDMLHFQNFTIGRAWASDYGMATDSKEMFDYIYKYSPLHNIDADKEYPAVMVTTADHDDRVVPAHSFKYIATLQNARPNNSNPLLIRIETKAGHGAGKPTEKILEEVADIYAFVFYNMEIKPSFK
ncbi:MAG: prolyl oligopeptidase family serine peptidase, partial [Bacteroidota bacterium]|nr:prolyl oligopeptidase family serine peptidase [Bacteroidota bacterium]